MTTLANANFTVYQAVIKGMYELRDAMSAVSTEATLAAATSTAVGRTLKRSGTLLGPPTKKKKAASAAVSTASVSDASRLCEMSPTHWRFFGSFKNDC
jgi:hypothetical protein